MQNKTRFVRATLVAFTMLAMVFSAGPGILADSGAKKEVKPYNQTAKPAQAKLINIQRANIFVNLASGSVFKGRNNPALYYLDEDGSRRVFPNEGTYMSWYDDFSGVIEVDDSQLADYPLKGNVRYRPGSFLVKVQTDPKVYVVGHNGSLRWIKTERLARDLYGDNWNKLIDDIPAAFFVNYQIGDLVDEISDFDPVLAAEIVSINENLKEKIKEKMEEKIVDQKLRYCKNLEKHLAKLQKRLAKWDLALENVGDDFVDRCVGVAVNDDQDDDDEDEDEDEDNDDDDNVIGKKVRICHVPNNDSDKAHTIIVSKSAAWAHIMHGDLLGRCDSGDDDDNDDTDITPPVISDILATPVATSTVITWNTDENSDGKVEYATDNIDSATTTITVNGSNDTTTHSITLEPLEPETTYYYIVKSEDDEGNIATSTEMTFTTDAIVVSDTTAPVITDIVAAPSSTTALITWTTDEVANSRIEYATDSLSSASTTFELTDSAFVTSHSFELTDLATSTMYYFIVESSDEAANTTSSTEQSFTTL